MLQRGRVPRTNLTTLPIDVEQTRLEPLALLSRDQKKVICRTGRRVSAHAINQVSRKGPRRADDVCACDEIAGDVSDLIAPTIPLRFNSSKPEGASWRRSSRDMVNGRRVRVPSKHPRQIRTPCAARCGRIIVHIKPTAPRSNIKTRRSCVSIRVNDRHGLSWPMTVFLPFPLRATSFFDQEQRVKPEYW